MRVNAISLARKQSPDCKGGIECQTQWTGHQAPGKVISLLETPTDLEPDSVIIAFCFSHSPLFTWLL